VDCSQEQLRELCERLEKKTREEELEKKGTILKAENEKEVQKLRDLQEQLQELREKCKRSVLTSCLLDTR